MPSLLSVTAESVPALALSVTGPPELLSVFPLASFARTVIVEIEEPSAATELGAAEIVVVEAAAAPGTISNDVLAVRPPADAEIVIGPAPCPVTVRVAIAPEAADVPRPATLPEPPVFVKVTELSAAVGFSFASLSSTARSRVDPDARAAVELVKTRSVAVPATIVNVVACELRPAAEAVTVTVPASEPVTVFDAVPLTVVAVPSPLTEPLPDVLANVIVRPESPATRLPFASSTRTVRSRDPPDARSAAGDVKRSCVAVPGTVVRSALVPVRPEPSVAVTVYVVSETVAVVNATEASPLAFVTEVVEPKEPPPPEPVFDQVTVRPARATGVPLASASCAVTVTTEPATGLELAAATTYFAGTGEKVTVALPPIALPPIVPVTFAVPGEVDDVSVAV